MTTQNFKDCPKAKVDNLLLANLIVQFKPVTVQVLSYVTVAYGVVGILMLMGITMRKMILIVSKTTG